MFQVAGLAVTYQEIQFAEGSVAGSDLLVPDQQFPAQQVGQHYLVQLLKVMAQPRPGRQREFFGHGFGVLIPVPELFPVIRGQPLQWLKAQRGVEQLWCGAEPGEMPYGRYLQVEERVGSCVCGHGLRIT